MKVACLTFLYFYAFYAFYAFCTFYAFYSFYACKITPNNLIYYSTNAREKTAEKHWSQIKK